MITNTESLHFDIYLSGGPMGHSRLESLYLKKYREAFEIVVSRSPRWPPPASPTSPEFSQKSSKNQTPHKTQKNQTLMPKGLQNDVKIDVRGTTFPNFSEIDETLILNDPTMF